MFYTDQASEKKMLEFYEQTEVDDILLLNGFNVLKSESSSRGINKKFQLIFNFIYFEKVVCDVKDFSDQKTSFLDMHGQVCSK